MRACLATQLLICGVVIKTMAILSKKTTITTAEQQQQQLFLQEGLVCLL